MKKTTKYEAYFLPREGEDSAAYYERMDRASRASATNPEAKRDIVVAVVAKALAAGWKNLGVNPFTAMPLDNPRTSREEQETGLALMAQTVREILPLLGGHAEEEKQVLSKSIAASGQTLDSRHYGEAGRIAKEQLARKARDKTRGLLAKVQEPFDILADKEKRGFVPEAGSPEATAYVEIERLYKAFAKAKREAQSATEKTGR